MSEFTFNHVGKSYPSFEVIHVKSSLQGSQAERSIYVSKYATVKSCWRKKMELLCVKPTQKLNLQPRDHDRQHLSERNEKPKATNLRKSGDL